MQTNAPAGLNFRASPSETSAEVLQETVAQPPAQENADTFGSTPAGERIEHVVSATMALARPRTEPKAVETHLQASNDHAQSISLRAELEGYLRMFQQLPVRLATIGVDSSPSLRQIVGQLNALCTAFKVSKHRNDLPTLCNAARARYEEIHAAVLTVRDSSVRMQLCNTMLELVGMPIAMRESADWDANTTLALLQVLTLKHDEARAKAATNDANPLEGSAVNDITEVEESRPTREGHCHPIVYFLASLMLDHPVLGQDARDWLASNDILFEHVLNGKREARTPHTPVPSRWCKGSRPIPNVRAPYPINARDEWLSELSTLEERGFAGLPLRPTVTKMHAYDTTLRVFAAHREVQTIWSYIEPQFLFVSDAMLPAEEQQLYCVDPRGKVLPSILLEQALTRLEEIRPHLRQLESAEHETVLELCRLAKVAEGCDQLSKADGTIARQAVFLVARMPQIAELAASIEHCDTQLHDAMVRLLALPAEDKKKQLPAANKVFQQVETSIAKLAKQRSLTTDQRLPAPVAKSEQTSQVRTSAREDQTSIEPHSALSNLVVNIAKGAPLTQIRLGDSLLWTRLSKRQLKELVSRCADPGTFLRYDDQELWQAKARCLAYHVGKHAAPRTPVEAYLTAAFAAYRKHYNQEVTLRTGSAQDYVRVFRSSTHVGVFGWDGALITFYSRDQR